MQETHAQVAEVDRWRLWPHRSKAASHGSGASKGVITICKAELDLEEKTAEGGRIVSAVTNWGGRKLHVINVYAPNVNKTHAAREEYGRFLDSLRRILAENDEDKVVMGDFNLVMDNDLDTGRPNSATYHPDLVGKLEEILETFNLCDAWRALHNDEPAFTFTRGNTVYRRLDYAFLSTHLLVYLQNITHKPTHLSDHSIITITFNKHS